MFRETPEKGVVVNGLWVFTGDRVSLKWKSIHAGDRREHRSTGEVVAIGYAAHPKTGEIESGFILAERGFQPTGFAESMIQELAFERPESVHIRDRRFPNGGVKRNRSRSRR